MADEEAAANAATDEALNNYDFSSSDAGASHTIPMDAGQIRKVSLTDHADPTLLGSFEDTGLQLSEARVIRGPTLKPLAAAAVIRVAQYRAATSSSRGVLARW